MDEWHCQGNEKEIVMESVIDPTPLLSMVIIVSRVAPIETVTRRGKFGLPTAAMCPHEHQRCQPRICSDPRPP